MEPPGPPPTSPRSAGRSWARTRTTRRCRDWAGECASPPWRLSRRLDDRTGSGRAAPGRAATGYDWFGQLSGSRTQRDFRIDSGREPCADEEFLRRVVLPPLHHPVDRQGSAAANLYDGDSQDKTVISDPPTPEMLASWRSQGRRTGWAIRRKLSAPNEVTTLELIGLVIGAALAGGIIGALFFSVPRGERDRVLSNSPAVALPARPRSGRRECPASHPFPAPRWRLSPPAGDRAAPGDQAAGCRLGSRPRSTRHLLPPQQSSASEGRPRRTGSTRSSATTARPARPLPLSGRDDKLKTRRPSVDG